MSNALTNTVSEEEIAEEINAPERPVPVEEPVEEVPVEEEAPVIDGNYDYAYCVDYPVDCELYGSAGEASSANLTQMLREVSLAEVASANFYSGPRGQTDEVAVGQKVPGVMRAAENASNGEIYTPEIIGPGAND